MSQHSSGSASHSSSFLRRISLNATPLSSPSDRWNKERQIITLFGHFSTFICLRALSGFAAESSPSKPSRTQTHDPVSYMFCGLQNIKGRASCLKRYRETHRVPQWLHKNMKALVWDSKRKAGSSETYDCIFVDPVSLLFKYKFYTVSTSEGGCFTHTGRYLRWKAVRLSCEVNEGC